MYVSGVFGWMKRVAGLAVSLGIMLFCSGASLAANNVLVLWDPSPSAGVQGYKLYYGTTPHSYTFTTDVGGVTNAIVSGLSVGATYYFAATAYDTNGLESAYSAEVSYLVGSTNVSVAPVIVLTSPANGSSQAAPATVNLSASVTSNGHNISKVQFYNGATLLAENTAAPYAYSWANVGVGRYTLTAQAVYDAGSRVATTAVLNVTNATVNPGNQAPWLTAITNQTIVANTATAPLSFAIGDAETAASNLVVYASSSAPALVADTNIVLGGWDSNRTVTVTPRADQTGQADITIWVSDGVATVSNAFHLTVWPSSGRPDNTEPTITAIGDQTMPANTSSAALGFVVGDAETAAAALAVTVSSSNEQLLPAAGLVLGGSGASRSLTLTPVVGQTGSAQVTVVVSDGELSASNRFELTVESAPVSVVQSGSGTVTLSTGAAPRLSNGKSYTLLATAAPGQVFGGWSGSTNWCAATLGIKARSNLLVSANFYPLKLVTNGVGGIAPNLAKVRGLIAGRTCVVTAVPGPGQLFAGWGGSVTSRLATVKVVLTTNLVLEANFVPNPFIPVKGYYSGLFYETQGVKQASSGRFALLVTSVGGYSGWLQMGLTRYGLSGRFDLAGQATNVVARANNRSLTVRLSLGLETGNADQVSGEVGDGVWVAGLSGDRQVYNGVSAVAPWKGRYTMVLPGKLGDEQVPAGSGYATVYVSGGGVGSMAGRLADGTPFTQSAYVSKGGQWPFYVPLYVGSGSVMSWLTFADRVNDDVNGALSWYKPANARARYYPEGFSYECQAVGSAYAVPAQPSYEVLSLTNADLAFVGGGLTTDWTNTVTVGVNSRVSNLSSNALSVSFGLGNGVFSGTVKDPVTQKVQPFYGAVLQKQNAAYGFLVGTNQTSLVSLTE